MIDSVHWTPPRRRTAADVARLALAALLRAAGASLDALALRLEAPARNVICPPSTSVAVVEFHADGGAPEGALYVDGRLIGWIDGVNRL